MRLKEDNTSWRSGGIKRRDFRHDPGLPETEVPHHKSLRRKKKKHVHTWKQTVIGKTTVNDWCRRPDGTSYRVPREMNKVQWVCTSCGNKRGHNYGGWR